MTLSHGEKYRTILGELCSTLPGRARKLLGLVQSTLRMRLLDRKPLSKWIHDSGRVILLGDACHPMVVRYIMDLPTGVIADIRSQPYKSQGAAMAIEDAAVLGNLLSRISHISQLGPLLEAYQDLRLGRTAAVQKTSRLSKRFFHLPDGPEQRERDEGLLKAMTSQSSGDNSGGSLRESAGNQNRQAAKSENDIMFGYDADDEVDRWWAARGRELEALETPKL